MCLETHLTHVDNKTITTEFQTFSIVKVIQCLVYSEFELGGVGWHSGESTCLPPLWPRFDSQTWHHMWVEFIVGSRPCSKVFSLDPLVFPAFSKTNISKFKSIWNPRAAALSVEDCLVPPSLNKVDLPILFNPVFMQCHAMVINSSVVATKFIGSRKTRKCEFLCGH